MNTIKDLLELYNGKKVFVTGHTGFKGAWLSIWLKTLGAVVIGYSLDPPSNPNLFEAVGLSSEIESVRGNILDLSHLKDVMKAAQPDIVFHLAAQPIVRFSYANPILTYKTNVMGTAHILETVRSISSVKVLVNVTSDKCYENREWVWGYREIESMGGRDPYSSSKGCAELITIAYRESFFPINKYGDTHNCLISSARAGNVIGGGDWGVDRLVPDCVRSLSKGKEVVIRFPHAIRPWQHVLEPLGGYLLLAAKLYLGETDKAGGWNFGPQEDEGWSVEQVVKEFIHVWGNGRYQVDTKIQPHEAHWLRLDCSKALLKLDWQSRLHVAEALAWSAEWYRLFYDDVGKAKLMEFTKKQIEAYKNKDNTQLSESDKQPEKIV